MTEIAEGSLEDVLAGRARWHLHRGDALAWLSSLPAGCANAVITDPPYSSGGRTIGARQASTSAKYQTDGTARAYEEFDGDHRDQRSWSMWMTLWLGQAWRACRPGAPICVFTDWRMLPAATDALQAGGWMWRGIAVWDKVSARPCTGRFTQQCEYLVWGSKGAMPIERLDGAPRRTLPGVLRHPVVADRKRHVTAKPLPLMLDVVEICEPGSLVLEPFAGSGTTGVAALRRGHRVLLAEQVPAYQEIALEELRSVGSSVP